MFQRFNSTLVLVLFGLALSAQPLKPLPHQMTDEEREAMPAFIAESFQSAKNTPPSLPPAAVRTMAEWEEVQALMITWTQYPAILTEIVRYAVDECLVLIVTNNSASASSQLTAAGVPLDNVEFLPVDFNSVWIRDYGPWTVYLNDVDSLAISDYEYNRPNRPDDDQVPAHAADYFNLPYYNADDNPYRWIHTGGNHLRDGLTAAWSSDLVLTENSGKAGREIDEYARLFLGVEDYRILRRLPYDGIHHLDMHMRTLDEETFAIGWYPEGIADGPQIEKNIEFIRNHYLTPYGRPYRVIRQQMPPENGSYPPFGDYRTYTNGIFVNNTFIIPVYEEQYDTTAIRIYEEYLPGYRVVGVDCNDMISALGAIHCITKLVGTDEPLRIAHPRLRDTYQTDGLYEVQALVQHRESISNVTLYYRIAPETEYTAMTMISGIVDDGMYFGSIPAQPAGTEVQYYIEATAESGKVQTRPLPAPEGYYFFHVKAYEEAPEARWVQRNPIVPQGSSILFTDDSGNGVTGWSWSFSGGEPASAEVPQLSVTYPDAGTFEVALTATNPIGSTTKVVSSAVRVPEALPLFSDDFSGGISGNWEVVNEDEDQTAWIWYEEAGCHGACLSVQNYSPNNRFTREYLRTSVSLPAGGDQTFLQFDVAYAPRSSTRWDELRINIIDQAGDITNVYNKGNNILGTSSNTGFPFTPDACNDWRAERVDLYDWAGQNIIVEFESIGDWGNNLYLDNVAFDVNAAPLVTITNPPDGTIYGGVIDAFDQNITIDANDSDGTIASVELYVDGTLAQTLTEAPYETTVTIDMLGLHCFQARAIDDEGAASWSEEVCIEALLDGVATIEPLPLHAYVHPNPTGEQASLFIQSQEYLPKVSLQLFDAEGRLLREEAQDIPAGEQQIPISLEQLPSGHYWLRLSDGERASVLEIVKIR